MLLIAAITLLLVAAAVQKASSFSPSASLQSPKSSPWTLSARYVKHLSTSSCLFASSSSTSEQPPPPETRNIKRKQLNSGFSRRKSSRWWFGRQQRQRDGHHHHRHRDPVTVYTEYASRLWNETNPEARQRMASSEKVVTRLIGQLQQQLLVLQHEQGDESSSSITPSSSDVAAHQARQRVIDSCDQYLAITTTTAPEQQQQQQQKDNNKPALKQKQKKEQKISTAVVAPRQQNGAAVSPPLKKKKKRRSIWFGVVMGFVVACWVFSGNYIFTGLFTLMTILGQLEYYRMVINTGVVPARRISVVGACSMFLTALFTPNLHQICLPMFGLWAMVWFLTMKRSVTTIPEIATTFTGMFYLGYVPSFWVRLRVMNSTPGELTRLAPLMQPVLNYVSKQAENLPAFVPRSVHLPITTGATFIFWTWLCLAFSDVGAYFVGKNFGKTKLGAVSPAAGATSPNKSVEGVLGGCAVSAGLAILGAWVQRWPYFVLTGAIHGVFIGLLGLIGDLTASMLKRDAGLKDFGDLIPEHGKFRDPPKLPSVRLYHP